MNIGKVDGPAWRSLNFRFNVNGFPTLFHVHNGPGGKEVRRISVQHTLDGIKYAAGEGWKQFEPLPWSTGPFGPVALGKYYGLALGERFFKLHEPIAHALDVPPVFTGFIFGLLMLMGFTGMLVGCAVWMGPPKTHDD